MENAWQTLQKELENPDTIDQRRLQIGEILEKLPDPRLGGEVTIRRIWLPERPGDEAKIMHVQHFNVTPFYIAQYQAFIDAADGFTQLTWWQGMPEAYQRQALYEQGAKLLNNPRAGLSWYQSVAFARWINHRLQGLTLPHPSGEGLLCVGDNAQIRLPTEWERQWAAQNGAAAHPYPWGEAKRGYANTVEAGLQQAIAVGMYPQGAAACGALDMAGNLMEWCANDKANLAVIDVASTAAKVLRGGDWGYSLENASCACCDDEAPNRIDILNGCRLVLA